MEKNLACLGGAVASAAVRAAWLRWSASLGSRPRLTGSLCQVIAAYALRLNSRAGTEGSTVSSLICDRWLILGSVTKAPGWAVATAGINSNVDVCEKAKHHTELFWWSCISIYSSQHSLGILYSRFSKYNNSDEVTNLADRLVRPAPTMTTFWR